MVANADGVETDRWVDRRGKDLHTYETSLMGLRIATNYKVEVTPTLDGQEGPPSPAQKARALGADLLIATKACKWRRSLGQPGWTLFFISRGSVEVTDEEPTPIWGCGGDGSKGNVKRVFLHL